MPIHSSIELEATNAEAPVAELDFLYSKANADFATTTPINRPHNVNSPIRKQPLQRLPGIPKWLNMEAASLADDEVLEMILTPIVPRRRTRLIAQALLKTFGTFGQVVHAPAGDLMAVEGLGQAGIVALKSVGALHMLRKAVTDAPMIRTRDELTNYLTARLQHEKVEIFSVIFLNGCNQMIADEELGRGTINHSLAYPRKIMRRCPGARHQRHNLSAQPTRRHFEPVATRRCDNVRYRESSPHDGHCSTRPYHRGPRKILQFQRNAASIP
jgi:DNA repair protein RadC